MDKLSYSRTVTIQACHFNDANTYRLLEQADNAEDVSTSVATTTAAAYRNLATALALWKEIALDCHGHNFRISVYAEGPVPDSGEASFLIADEKLVELVGGWEGCNLSLLDEFREVKARATTEWMARLLLPAVRGLCENKVELIRVTVAENENICSTIEWRL